MVTHAVPSALYRAEHSPRQRTARDLKQTSSRTRRATNGTGSCNRIAQPGLPLAPARTLYSPQRRSHAVRHSVFTVTSDVSTATAIGEDNVAVVVGAGPVGIATAAMLAKRGWRVEVVDRRQDPSVSAAPPGASAAYPRTYPMSINARATNSLLHASGLDGQGYFGPHNLLKGITFIKAEGDPSEMTLPSNYTQLGKSYLVDWSGLTSALLAETKDKYGECITFHWGCQLSDPAHLDLPHGMLRVNDSQELELQYSLLVGADGAESVVRRALAESGQLETRTRFKPFKCYKCFHGLDADLADERFSSTEEGQRLLAAQRGWAGMSFWRRDDGSMSVMVSASKDDFDPVSFRRRLLEAAPDLPQDWLHAMADQNEDPNRSPAPNLYGRIVHNTSFWGQGQSADGAADTD